MSEVTELAKVVEGYHREVSTKITHQLPKIERSIELAERNNEQLRGLRRVVVGDLATQPVVVGHAQRIEALERFTDSMQFWGRKFFWLIAVGVLGLFGSLIWQVIRSYLSSGASG